MQKCRRWRRSSHGPCPQQPWFWRRSNRLQEHSTTPSVCLSEWLHTSASSLPAHSHPPILTILIYSVFRGPMDPSRWGSCLTLPTGNLSLVLLPGHTRRRVHFMPGHGLCDPYLCKAASGSTAREPHLIAWFSTRPLELVPVTGGLLPNSSSYTLIDKHLWR